MENQQHDQIDRVRTEYSRARAPLAYTQCTEGLSQRINMGIICYTQVIQHTLPNCASAYGHNEQKTCTRAMTDDDVHTGNPR